MRTELHFLLREKLPAYSVPGLVITQAGLLSSGNRKRSSKGLVRGRLRRTSAHDRVQESPSMSG